MQNSESSPSHYVWQVPGKQIAIHIDFDVIDRLSMDVMRGFGAVPRRGAEVGGVLLGSIELGGKLIVRIEDFELVPCDYKRGPSYLLTESDSERLSNAIARNAPSPDKRFYTVGFFRSHTRDGLGLTNEDIQVFQQYLGDPTNVMLLIRPFATKASVGGFFFEESGSFRQESSYLEFPFRRRELGGGVSPSMRSTPSPEDVGTTSESSQGEEVETPQQADEPDLRDWVKTKGGRPGTKTGAANARQAAPDPKEKASVAGIRGKWLWLPLSFVFLLMGVILGFQTALTLNRADVDKSAVRNLQLALTASKDTDGVVIRWDRRSVAVQNARSGLLHIQDGDFRKSVPLDARQLKNGSVIYRSAEGAVSFRFEVLLQEGGTVSESVEFSPNALSR